MFAKIVVSAVLVSIVSCESRHQKFVEVPFDDGRSEQKTQHSTPQLQQTFHTSFIGTTSAENPRAGPIASNQPFRQQLSNEEPELLLGSPLGARFKDADKSTFQGHRGSELPGINKITGSIRHSPTTAAFGEPQLNNRLLNSATKPKASSQPATTFLATGEPVFRFIERSTEKPHKASEDASSISSFLEQVRPEVQAPVVPASHQVFRSQLPSVNRQQVSQNPRLPEQPQFLIHVQPETTSPSRPFVRPQTQDNHLGKEPTSNSLLQGQIEQELAEKVFKQQAETAKYSFASHIDDNINGNQHQREEVRNGLNVQGMYSYSDGYVKRTVFYEADDKGFRVVREEEEPLGNGPQVNPNGQANVSSYISGNAIQYSITAADIQDNQNTPRKEKPINIFNI